MQQQQQTTIVTTTAIMTTEPRTMMRMPHHGNLLSFFTTWSLLWHATPSNKLVPSTLIQPFREASYATYLRAPTVLFTPSTG